MAGWWVGDCVLVYQVFLEMGIRTEGVSVEWGRVGEGAKRVGI